jgi:oligosaccharide repeat unit polymerase
MLLLGCLVGGFACVIPALEYRSMIGLACALTVFAVATSICMDALQRRFDAFDAKHVFALTYLLYVLPWPILVYLGSTPELLDVVPADEWYVTAATGLTGLALLFFYLGVSLSNVTHRDTVFSGLGREDASRLLLVACALTTVNLGLLAWYVGDVGGVRTLLAARYQVFELHQGRILPSIWLNLLPVNLLLLYYLATRYRRVAVRIPMWGLIAAGAILLLWLGRRRHLMMFLLSACAYRHYAVQRFKFWQILVGAVTGFTFGNLLGSLRTGSLDVLLEYAKHVVESGTVFYALTGAGEFSTASAWLPFVMEAVRTRSMDYLYGGSYLLIPTGFVPRALYPDRPSGLSEWYTFAFFPEAGAQGGSVAVPLLAEAYLNFGAVGLLVITLVIGAALAWLRARLLRLDSRGIPVEPRAVLLYSTIVGWIPSMIRVDLGAWLKEYVIYWLATLLLVFWFSARDSKDEPRHASMG